MTIEEKSKAIQKWCNERILCDAGCPLFGRPNCFTIRDSSDHRIIEHNYEIIFGSDDTSASTNAVNHPSHYNKGKIEVWDFISDWKLNFDRGNAIKYICRAGEKDPTKEIQDLEKAIEYINHEIKILKGEIENGKTEEN